MDKSAAIKDQLISFETAKTLKEKGFNLPTYYYYNRHGNLHEPFLENGSSTDVEFRVDLADLCERRNSQYNRSCAAPSQEALKDWLRTVYNIHIDAIKRKRLGYTLYVRKINHEGDFPCVFILDDSNASYHELTEMGLKEALKHIKNGEQ